MDALQHSDPEIHEAIRREALRQNDSLELIASENFTSLAVLEATGSVMTNKYAEGYPGRRYYGGCEWVDVAERLAIERCRELFGAEHANVQPHSGASANLAAFMAFLEPGDTFLGMSLTHGGHLTHGAPVNFSGRLYQVASYGVREDDARIDYDEVREIALRERPKMLIAGASAYPRSLDFEAFASIAREVDALFLVDMAHIAGLVAGGAHANPVPHADIVTSTTHKTLRGPRSGFILTREGLGKAVDKEIFPGLQGGPLMHVIAAKAVAFREALSPDFDTYAHNVVTNAQTLADTLQERGLELVSGGTDNHLLLLDLRHGEMTGKDAEEALGHAGITVNKNTVPGETRSPFVTSGVRIGTAALTTRGMGPEEMRRVGGWIADALEARNDAARLEAIRREIEAFCADFPIYPEARSAAAAPIG